MIEKISVLTTWATGMAFLPKIVFSILIVLVALLFLLLLWAPKHDANTKEQQHSNSQYIVTVNSFKNTDNKEIRLKLVGVIHSAGINVRDGGPAWETPEKAWEHWQTFVSPKLAPSVVNSTDIFIVRHNGKPELSNHLKDIINGMFPKLVVSVHQAGSGKDKNPNVSIQVSSKNMDRFRIE